MNGQSAMERIEGSDLPERELPKYKCHKTVYALKIARVQFACGNRAAGHDEETDGGAIITPVESGYAPFRVSREYMLKHKPEVGGYWVRYQDGYESFSPAKAFEDGYVQVG